jgi:Zn-dependent hydrolases, including glyoxylases
VPAQFKVFWETATKNLKPNRERMQFIKDGEEIIPGVHAMLAPGHTVGHTIFMIDSGGKQLCYVGDLAHHPVLLLQKPLTEFKYDTDPKQSAQSRVKMLSMLAETRRSRCSRITSHGRASATWPSRTTASASIRKG